MYANPILFPALSNREDLLRTISLFDDDTGEAIDVSGRTLAAPGDFTAAAWNVVCGNIVTASISQLTIKDYPIGSEMQALALIVDQNLGILSGDPITIADLSGLNTMSGYVTGYAPSTGKLVCQIGTAFAFGIIGHHHCAGGGFGAPWESGGSESPVISAQLGNGIALVDLGRLQIRIPAATMSKLRHKTYGVAMSMFDGADTRQMFLGRLPVLHGGVSMMPLPSPSANPYGLP